MSNQALAQGSYQRRRRKSRPSTYRLQQITCPRCGGYPQANGRWIRLLPDEETGLEEHNEFWYDPANWVHECQDGRKRQAVRKEE